MIIISHRGNLIGSMPDYENHPSFIQEAIDIGYSVEIDMRICNGKILLGHDIGQYEVDLTWLKDRQKYLWIHCKNYESLEFCLINYLHCFWHNTDDYTITSKGYVWAYPGSKIEGNGILVLPERIMKIDEVKNVNCYGVCTDFTIDVSKSLMND